VIDINTVGARLPLSPRYNFALLGTYNLDLVGGYTGSINVTDRWIGDRNAGFGSALSPQYKLASYNITDLKLSVLAPYHVQYGLFVRNVFDRAGEVSAIILANEYNPDSPVPVFLAQPRTIGLSVNYKFQ
jgi:outer membrane receptor protein involved in Fe transport